MLNLFFKSKEYLDALWLAINLLLKPFKLFFSFKSDINLVISIFMYLVIFSFLEYHFQISKTWNLVGLIIIYVFPFLGSILITAIFRKNYTFIKSFNFWILCLSVVTILIANDYFKFIIPIIRAYFPEEYRFIIYKLFTQIEVWIYYSIPYLIWMVILLRTKKNSISNRKVQKVIIPFSYYFLILVPMVFLVIIISHQKDFQSYYPIAPLDKPEFGYIADYRNTIIFEIFYILAFVATEWFFRGFLLKSFGTIFRKDSILIMTSLYVSIHFEKPIIETISSIFGGFALGTIAFYTGKIRGGVLLHVGIALTMEAMGFYWLHG